MFDEKVDQLSLTEHTVSFTIRCNRAAACIAEALTFNGLGFTLTTRYDETTNEWNFVAPRHALGTLRTL